MSGSSQESHWEAEIRMLRKEIEELRNGQRELANSIQQLVVTFRSLAAHLGIAAEPVRREEEGRPGPAGICLGRWAVHIRYRVDATHPEGHRGRFSIELGGVASPILDLVVPSWVPGSYHLVNYVRGFRDLVARAEPEETPLTTDRVESSRWRIHTQGHAEVRVDYLVYGHEMVTEAFDLTSDHLFLNAALSLPYVDGHQSEPVEVELHLPADWSIVTELEEVRNPSPDLPRAELRLAGRQPPGRRPPPGAHGPTPGNPAPHLAVRGGRQLRSPPIGGGPHEGRGGHHPPRRGFPAHGYTFFVHLNDVPDGGLEHATSNSGIVARTLFQPQERYEQFLSLESHEYFHLYNVKRIRPKVLDSFDYTRENYTRLLWWMEGTTDYFSDLVLRRANLYTPARYLEEEAKWAKLLLETPGRRSLSLEELSQIAWTEYYQPYQESPNQSVSYYVKGHVVSLCLDLEIRAPERDGRVARVRAPPALGRVRQARARARRGRAPERRRTGDRARARGVLRAVRSRDHRGRPRPVQPARGSHLRSEAESAGRHEPRARLPRGPA